MIPLRDINPTRRFAVVTAAIIAINVVIFILELSLNPLARNELSCSAGLIACQVTNSCPQTIVPRYACLAFANSGPPVVLDFITTMFLHGGWMHLLGNMLYLWIFGNNIEDILGRVRFILFYLLCGIVASLVQVLVNTDAAVPIIGASGAVAGVLGAYLVLFPNTRIQSLVFVFYFVRLIEIPAIIVLGLWFVLQFFNGLASVGMQQMGGVAYFAHVGGFVAGIILIYLFPKGRRPGPPRRRQARQRNVFQEEFPDLWD
jgi:membrane associated rhomboid family serine protease